MPEHLDRGLPSDRSPESRLERAAEALAVNTSRRGFLARVSGALIAAAGAGAAVRAVIPPGDAQAHHFCGHTFTTGSCPHPAGSALPRIDAHGYPIRARDGRPVDDSGRPVDHAGRPVDEHGRLLLDTDGRPLPPSPRKRLCEDITAERHGFPAQTDGAWYRCCGGHVRKLTDCCAHHSKRINGDAALTGYCYGGRKVFCVMYYETKVPC
jgi:hypothetical protein